MILEVIILPFLGGKDCTTRTCLRCLNDRDCGSNRYCSAGLCLTGTGNRISGDCSSDRDCTGTKCPPLNHCECKINNNRGSCELVRCFSKYSCTKYYDTDCKNGYCTKNRYVGK